MTTNITYRSSDLITAEVQLIQTEKELCGYNKKFTEGEFDGSTGEKPNPVLWCASAEYRKGYLAGLTELFDIQLGGLVE